MRWKQVEITAGALLLWALLYYLDSDGMVMLVLSACTLHELGHYIAIRLLGGQVARLRITCVGAEMVLSARRPLGSARELSAALAGPAVNLLLALGCAGLGKSWWCFAGVNLALALFNLLPVGPLDGGRALGCLLTLAGKGDWAEPAVALLSAGLCMGLTMGALLLWRAGERNLTLLLVALWLTAAPFRGKMVKKAGRT
uniref:site-2 protease family protein n=1 Tax=uncultured Flavonifractor sp. TaxID=1193534 RepID=UPI00262EF3AB|nr:site-2 protease family protein [uncultured Flavonifractor sp.]